MIKGQLLSVFSERLTTIILFNMDGESIAPHGKSESASIGVHLFVSTVVLNCSSPVDHGEDSYQVRGQCQSPPQCLPGSLDRARRNLETAFAEHFHELGCHCGLVVVVVLLHPLLYSIQHFSGELKRPTTPYTYFVNCREFHE